MIDKIVIKVLNTQCYSAVGCITLNKPKALNAVDLEMVRTIQTQLDSWRDDDTIGAIFIDGEGDRAFCAGGDIVSMYQAMVEQKTRDPERLPDFMAQFFEQEYRLDYTIHAYPKPIICWGNGITMGGGLGIFAGASHKVVTESAHVAMPEITIGLFPDVGASFFLNKMPQGVGKFLGLSAMSINALDCINIGLADTFLAHGAKQLLLDKLTGLDRIDAHSIDDALNDLHNEGSTQALMNNISGNLTLIQPFLAPLADMYNIDEIESFFDNLQAQFPDLKPVQKAIQSFRHGSPITTKLVLEQLKRGQSLSLAQCFQMELSIAYQCSVTGEFQEGVRALLIDKDNQPKWKYAHASDVPDIFVNAHFEQFANGSTQEPQSEKPINPLHSLVQEFGEGRV